jgi:hypothetical protein
MYISKVKVPHFICLQINSITLSVVVGYFFFHLLYYALMLGRETESLVLDRSHWRKLLGLHVWYITRPMFALIGYGWNIIVPLAPFSFDPDFQVGYILLIKC